MTDGRPSPPGVGVWRRWMLRARRRLRQWRGAEPRTRVQIRCERALLDDYKARVYIFDCYSFIRTDFGEL